MTTFEAARKWGINRSRVSVLLREGRIPGALQLQTPQGSRWHIPDDAPEPIRRPAGNPNWVSKETR